MQPLVVFIFKFCPVHLKTSKLFLCPSINCFLICLILPKAARALKLSYFSLKRIFKVAADGIKNPRKIVNHSGLWKLVHVATSGFGDPFMTALAAFGQISSS